jgi:hypothetical protein
MKKIGLVPLVSSVELHVKIQDTVKGKGVFAMRKFSQGEIVVVGIFVKEIAERTIFSLQMDFNLHVNVDEPACVINHSCEPNTGVRNNQFSGYDFVALRDINAGEEITFDYETTEYESIAVPHCLCGSIYCRRDIIGYRFRGEILRDRYGDYIADYLKTLDRDYSQDKI